MRDDARGKSNQPVVRIVRRGQSRGEVHSLRDNVPGAHSSYEVDAGSNRFAAPFSVGFGAAPVARAGQTDVDGRVQRESDFSLADPSPLDRLKKSLGLVPGFAFLSEAVFGRAYSFATAVATATSRQVLSFAACVLLPTFFSIVYFGLIASDEYVAEFRFAVKDASTPKAGAAGGLMSALGVSGVPNPYDNYLVTDFLSSRQAADELQKRVNVISLYSRPNIDWFGRFNPSRPIEDFVDYWQSKISARYDPMTGIASAKVRAYSAEDALVIANELVTLSEELVNRITNRSQSDAVKFAQREVERAEDRMRAIRAKLSEYRERVGVIDPNSSVVASNSTLIKTLQANLAQLQLQHATLLRQNLNPESPAVVALQNQIRATQEQIKSIEGSVGSTPDGRILSKVVAEYEQVDLERQFAQNMITDAMRALDQARATAASQHLYITPYVRPSLPQSSTHPRRLLSIFVVALIGLIVWLCGLLLVRSIEERFH